MFFCLLFVGVFLLIFAFGVASYLWFFAKSVRSGTKVSHLATFHETKALPGGKKMVQKTRLETTNKNGSDGTNGNLLGPIMEPEPLNVSGILWVDFPYSSPTIWGNLLILY